jgi:hypothetical protein
MDHVEAAGAHNGWPRLCVTDWTETLVSSSAAEVGYRARVTAATACGQFWVSCSFMVGLGRGYMTCDSFGGGLRGPEVGWLGLRLPASCRRVPGAIQKFARK